MPLGIDFPFGQPVVPKGRAVGPLLRAQPRWMLEQAADGRA